MAETFAPAYLKGILNPTPTFGASALAPVAGMTSVPRATYGEDTDSLITKMATERNPAPFYTTPSRSVQNASEISAALGLPEGYAEGGVQPMTHQLAKQSLGTDLKDRLKGWFTQETPNGRVLSTGGIAALQGLSTGLQTYGDLKDIKAASRTEENRMLREFSDREFVQRSQVHFDKLANLQSVINNIKAMKAKLGGSYAGQQQQLFGA